MIKNLSDTVILPIAGIILTFVLCYEIIQMILENNNMVDFDTLLGLYFESMIVKFTIQALKIGIFFVVYGRMLQIYLTVSIAAIPFSTMINREWGQMGQNYLKGLFALAFQGFLIMVCVAIYAVLVQSIVLSDNIHIAILTCIGYPVLLCLSLFQTGALSKRIFGTCRF